MPSLGAIVLKNDVVHSSGEVALNQALCINTQTVPADVSCVFFEHVNPTLAIPVKS